MIILKMESIKQVKGRNYWCMQNWWILKIILDQRSLNKREISQVYDFINVKLYKQKLPNIDRNQVLHEIRVMVCG